MQDKTKGKNVGILTFHFSNHNYGAVLQCYASYIYLKSKGFNPTIINLLPKKNINLFAKIKAGVLNIFNSKNNFNKFRHRNLKLTNKVTTLSDLTKLNKDFDIIYVGSDQVWRPIMSGKLLSHYFLDFADDNKIKIAYAASFGTDEWEGNEKETKLINNLIRRFDAISVREEEGVRICRNVFGVNASHVLDPTLLIEKNSYESLLSPAAENDLYIGYYLLSKDNDESTICNQIKYESGFVTKNLYGRKIKVFNSCFLRYNKVEKWLKDIKNSHFIITDSYHCVIFSIIFNKNFVCLKNNSAGISRIKNLLNLLDLNDRLCLSENIDFKKYINTTIDYNLVNQKLEMLKQDSIRFLADSIN